MKYMQTNEIRNKFLTFFSERKHKIYKSFPLIPIDDTSLLLINSGMAPLKKFFTNEKTAFEKQIVSCQKCIRTQDIEIIGKTLRHSTFFEMLGNFSFGTYFKIEAITFAWDFIINILNIPEEKLFISVYYDDIETYNIWVDKIKINKNHIIKLGRKDNFWEIGAGPCGPSTEIYYDNGIEFGCKNKNCIVGCNCNRYVEFWNLVFSQYNNDGNGNYKDLITKNIDTGMGLERIAAIMQNVNSIFDIDISKNIIKKIKNLLNQNDKENPDFDISIKIIYDHIKSIVMMIADNIVPTHDGRGYVLKRLIRRGIYHGNILGLKDCFLYKIAPTVIDEYSLIYPNLKENYDNIINTIKTEENKFKKTLILGENILQKKIFEINKKNISYINTDELIYIYNTYGMPIEISKEILDKNKILVIEKNIDNIIINDNKKIETNSFENSKLLNIEFNFTNCNCECYEKKSLKSNIIKILDKNYNFITTAKTNNEIIIITSNTPFYAESGGQKSDIGLIKNDKCEIQIIKVILYKENLCLHIGKILSGTLNIGDIVDLIINEEYRNGITRAHTTAHILHKLLRKKYNNNLRQYGSSIDDDSFRFDITYKENFSDTDIQNFEYEINEIIFNNLKVNTKYINNDEIANKDIIALFQDKYGSKVRVVSIGNYSKEVCKGTHVSNTSKIYMCKILSVSTISNGIKRFYVLTGKKAIKYDIENKKILQNIKNTFNANDNNILEKIENYNSEFLELKLKYKNLINDFVLSMFNNINYKMLDQLKIYIEIKDDINYDIAKQIMSKAKKIKIQNGIFVFINKYKNNKSCQIFVYCSNDCITKTFNAKFILKKFFIDYNGKGGGDSSSATGILNYYDINNDLILKTLKEIYCCK